MKFKQSHSSAEENRKGESLSHILSTIIKVYIQDVPGAQNTEGLNFYQWGLDSLLGSGIVFKQSTTNNVK